jgi:hypothetical protein
VEVNPEDVHQESASETNCSSIRSRKSSGSLSFSQRKNKKLQWVITRVDNGNLHRPRPAYYGPSEEDSSDSAMEVDRSDMETTSPGARGSSGMLPISPGVQNQGPGSPIPLDHSGRWAPVVPQESEEAIARRRHMFELESQMNMMKSQMEAIQAEYERLQTVEAREAQKLHNGPQITGPGYPPPGVGMPPDNRSVPLNPRALEDYSASNSEAISRYVQQSPTEEPGPYPFMSRTKETKRGAAGGHNRCDHAPEPVSTMLSPPETVASPPGEHTGAPGPRVQQGRRPSVPSVPYVSTAPRQHIPAPPARASTGTRNANGGPPEKTVKCQHPGCKSKFARESELRYVVYSETRSRLGTEHVTGNIVSAILDRTDAQPDIARNSSGLRTTGSGTKTANTTD